MPSSFPLGPFCFYLFSFGCSFPPSLLPYSASPVHFPPPCPEVLCSDAIFSSLSQISFSSLPLTVFCFSSVAFLFVPLSCMTPYDSEGSLRSPCLFSAKQLLPAVLHFSLSLFLLSDLPFLALFFSSSFSVPSAFACSQAYLSFFFCFMGICSAPLVVTVLSQVSPQLDPKCPWNKTEVLRKGNQRMLLLDTSRGPASANRQAKAP